MKALGLKDRKEFATLVVEDYCPVVPRILVAQQFGETVKVHAGLQRIQL